MRKYRLFHAAGRTVSVVLITYTDALQFTLSIILLPFKFRLGSKNLPTQMVCIITLF